MNAYSHIEELKGHVKALEFEVKSLQALLEEKEYQVGGLKKKVKDLEKLQCKCGGSCEHPVSLLS